MNNASLQEIFRAYDIRGIVDSALSETTMRSIGQAIGTEARTQNITQLCVGRDGRLSGPRMIKAVINGLLSTGINVVDIGAVPTPILYYAAQTLHSHSGVMITGSHNPSNYNGLKMIINAQPLSCDAIQNLYYRVINNDFIHGKGTYQILDVTESYRQAVFQSVPVNTSKKIKLVVDCGNGIAGNFAPKLYEDLGHEVIPLYSDVDGNFPNHHPDPSDPKNLQDLIHRVREEQADIGFAFDGDGDRLGLVTNKGDIIWPDRLMMLFATDILKRIPNAQFIYDVKSSNLLKTVIEQHHGRPLMWKTGHSLIKGKLKETGASLAGEMSGHFFFNDRWFGFDDALYAGARLLEILSQTKQTVSEIFATFPNSYNTPELKIAMPDAEKYTFIETLIQHADFPNAELITLDGLRVNFSSGFGLVRASNTTPCLVCRFEAETQIQLEKIQQDFKKLLLSLNNNLDIPF